MLSAEREQEIARQLVRAVELTGGALARKDAAVKRVLYEHGLFGSPDRCGAITVPARGVEEECCQPRDHDGNHGEWRPLKR